MDRRKFLTGLGAGAAAGLAGCGGDGDDGDGGGDDTTEGTTDGTTEGTTDGTTEGTPGGGTTTTGGGEPAEGGTPVIGMNIAPETLNPLVADSTYDFYLLDRILGYGTANHPENQNFSAWSITDWTLEPDNVGTDSPTLQDVAIHEDLTFHDGEDVTAEDVKFSIEYFRDQNPTASLNGQAQQVVDSVEMTGDYTVDIYMSGRDQRWFTNILGWPILPMHIWQDVDDYTQYVPRESDEGVVGCGAWELVDFNWENWFELEVVDDYPIPGADYVEWLPDDAPYLDGLRFEIYGSQSSLEQALLNGEVDAGFVAGGFTADTAAEAENDDGLSVNQASEVGYNHQSYNLRRVPFDDVAFRQFLNKCLDETWIVEEPYSGIGAVAGDYTVIPALERWRPPEPEELAGSDYRAENLPEDFDGTANMPDLSFPGEAGSFELTEDQVQTARDFLLNHEEAEHDYSFGEAVSDVTTAPDGQELYVNGEALTEAHTDNDGNGGQGPLEFSFQPPQGDIYQSRTGNNFVGVMRQIGIPMDRKVRTQTSQSSTVYEQEDFDLYSMGWGLSVNATHFANLYGAAGVDEEGTDTAYFNPMAYTGAQELIDQDLQFLDFDERTPFVKQIQTQIYKDAPTCITDVSQLLEPVNASYEGWFATLGTSLNEDSFLNLHQVE